DRRATLDHLGDTLKLRLPADSLVKALFNHADDKHWIVNARMGSRADQPCDSGIKITMSKLGNGFGAKWQGRVEKAQHHRNIDIELLSRAAKSHQFIGIERWAEVEQRSEKYAAELHIRRGLQRLPRV